MNRQGQSPEPLENESPESDSLDGELAIQEAILDTEPNERLHELIEQGDPEQVRSFVDSMDETEWVSIISRLELKSQVALIRQLEDDVSAEIIHRLPDEMSTEILQSLQPVEVVEVIDSLPRNEQAEIVSDFSDSTQQAVYAEMPSEAAEAIEELTHFEENVAGSLMIVEFLEFNMSSSVNDVIQHLRANSEAYSDFDVQYAFVTDDQHELKGVLRLRDLLLARGSQPVSELMIHNPIAVKTEDALEELHHFFEAHNFLGAPVVDPDGRIKGVVSREIVESKIAENLAIDLRKTQGIVEEELRTMPTLLRARRRLSWLSVNILLNVFAASVIAYYQDVLAEVIALAVFLPIISDMSGCSGNQAVAVSMRELSLGLVRPTELFRVWLKEISVGVMNGFALGGLLTLAAFIWQGSLTLGIVVGIAMCTNTIVAVSIGGTLPLLMKRMNFDPALASGPILTTITDMCGFMIALSLAAMLLTQ